MKRYVTLGALLLGLAAAPVSAEAQNPQRFLQGLTNGDSGRDQAVNEAFQRGYQKGRQDEARMEARRGTSNDPDRAGSARRPYPEPTDRPYSNNGRSSTYRDD